MAAFKHEVNNRDHSALQQFAMCLLVIIGDAHTEDKAGKETSISIVECDCSFEVRDGSPEMITVFGDVVMPVGGVLRTDVVFWDSVSLLDGCGGWAGIEELRNGHFLA